MAEGEQAAPATGTGTGTGRARSRQAKPASAATKRVVLRRERVIVVPEDADAAKVAKAVAAASQSGPKGAPPRPVKIIDAWVEVGVFPGHSKLNAIVAVAGKAGTPDAIPGAYKAPGVTAWAGGEEYIRPPQTKIERRPLA
jgi:hypothetical protein